MFFNKAVGEIGISVRALVFPDFWLEVSLHPEGPATRQLEQGFPWFSLVPEQNFLFHKEIFGQKSNMTDVPTRPCYFSVSPFEDKTERPPL
jgi:hypothetical protein